MERARWIWPLSILGFALLLRLLLFTGLQGGDDRLYSATAYRMSRGETGAGPDLFKTRVAYVGPVAAAYALFGVHVAALIVPSLLASLGLAALAYRLGLLFGTAPLARTAALFVALLPLDVFYATTANTDLLLAALIGLGTCLLCDPATSGKTVWALLAGASWGAAHLTKESAVLLVLPALPLAWQRAPRKSMILALGAAAAVVALELAVYGVTTGDPLHRVHMARAAQMGPGASSDGFASRLAALPSFCVNPWDAGFPFTGGLQAIALAGAAGALLRDRRRSGALAAWWLAGGLFLTLAPVSLFPYRPALQLQARMYAVLTLPGALLAAHLVAEGLARYRRITVAGLAVAAALALLCSARVHQDAVAWRSGAEWAHRELASHPGSLVITDPRTAEMLRQMSGYHPAFTLRDYGSADPAPVEGTILLDNPKQAGVSRSWDGVEAPAWWTTAIPPRRILGESVAPAPWRLRGPSGPGTRTALIVVTK